MHSVDLPQPDSPTTDSMTGLSPWKAKRNAVDRQDLLLRKHAANFENLANALDFQQIPTHGCNPLLNVPTGGRRQSVPGELRGIPEPTACISTSLSDSAAQSGNRASVSSMLGGCSGNAFALTLIAHPGQGADEHLRIGVQRMFEQLRRLADFHHSAGVHDADSICDLIVYAQIVADDDHGVLQLLLQAHQHHQDALLHHHVQCRRRFVGQHNAWAHEGRQGDDHSLWRMPPESWNGYASNTSPERFSSLR